MMKDELKYVTEGKWWFCNALESHINYGYDK